MAKHTRFIPGSITWKADDTLPAAAGQTLRNGRVVDAPDGTGRAVMFSPILMGGKNTRPIVRLAGRPSLAAIVQRDEDEKAAREREKERARAERKAFEARLEAELRALADPIEVDPENLGRSVNYCPMGATFRAPKSGDNSEDDFRAVHLALCRPATEEEAAPVRAKLESRRRAREANDELKAIGQQIRETGEWPPRGEPGPDSVWGAQHAAEGETVAIGSGQTIYGGGEWLVLGTQWIWHCVNNGADGDDWKQSNVRTGGAGAIGWRVPATAELAERIRGLRRIKQGAK